jgi:predicted P-loop ATPase
MGAEDTALNRAFGRKTLVAAVRRARQPGCKFDYMLMLEGEQRAGKSSAVQILAAARENFSDTPIKWDDPQKQMEAVGGIWLYEVSELVGLRKADVENVKNFLSRQVDRVRPSYGRHRVDRPRRCVFIGTVNPDKGGKVALWSNDPSGATRFWPVVIGVVGVIDLEALKKDRDQLWAEASAIEAKGEPLPIDPSLYKDATLQQELRQAPDPWMDVLDGVVGTVFQSADGDMERVSTRDLFVHYLEMHGGQMTSATSTRLARVMHRLGWSGPKVLHLPEKGRFRGYERPAPVKEGTAQGPERPKGPAPAK